MARYERTSSRFAHRWVGIWMTSPNDYPAGSQCPHCQYCLTGSPIGRCPECGVECTVASITLSNPSRFWNSNRTFRFFAVVSTYLLVIVSFYRSSEGNGELSDFTVFRCAAIGLGVVASMLFETGVFSAQSRLRNAPSAMLVAANFTWLVAILYCIWAFLLCFSR